MPHGDNTQDQCGDENNARRGHEYFGRQFGVKPGGNCKPGYGNALLEQRTQVNAPNIDQIRRESADELACMAFADG